MVGVVLRWTGGRGVGVVRGEGGGREVCPTGARSYRSLFSAPRFSDAFAD